MAAVAITAALGIAGPAPYAGGPATDRVDTPTVAGLVAGATGYAHPTNWPPPLCPNLTPLEAFVQSQIDLSWPC